MDTLKSLKLLKGITDDLQDDLLNLVIELSEQAILTRINRKRKEPLKTLPNELNGILIEVSSKRFNRLDSEGTTKHEREGESFTWESLLGEYEVDFEKYMDDENDLSKKGVLRIW